MSTASSLPASGLPNPAPGSSGWYCLRVIARREHITARNLEQRTGVPVFSASIRVRRQGRSGLAAWMTEALFPGYLFARFGYPREVRHVASTPGVLGLVAFGGPPPVVADEVIAHLETEVRRAVATPAASGFTAGSWVRIISGCFRGNEGRVLDADPSATRISVLLNLLGRDVRISLPGDQLQDREEFVSAPDGLRADADRNSLLPR